MGLGRGADLGVIPRGTLLSDVFSLRAVLWGAYWVLQDVIRGRLPRKVSERLFGDIAVDPRTGKPLIEPIAVRRALVSNMYPLEIFDELSEHSGDLVGSVSSMMVDVANIDATIFNVDDRLAESLEVSPDEINLYRVLLEQGASGESAWMSGLFRDLYPFVFKIVYAAGSDIQGFKEGAFDRIEYERSIAPLLWRSMGAALADAYGADRIPEFDISTRVTFREEGPRRRDARILSPDAMESLMLGFFKGVANRAKGYFQGIGEEEVSIAVRALLFFAFIDYELRVFLGFATLRSARSVETWRAHGLENIRVSKLTIPMDLLRCALVKARDLSRKDPSARRFWDEYVVKAYDGMRVSKNAEAALAFAMLRLSSFSEQDGEDLAVLAAVMDSCGVQPDSLVSHMKEMKRGVNLLTGDPELAAYMTLDVQGARNGIRDRVIVVDRDGRIRLFAERSKGAASAEAVDIFLDDLAAEEMK